MTSKHIQYLTRLLSLAFVIILSGVLTACSDISRDQRRVRKAAERCYDYLQEGKFEKFVGEIAYADSMSDDYRDQMIDLVHEFAASEEKRHGELINVEAVGDTIIGSMAHVYLQIHYADSTSEEIGLPMVKVDGKWKMQ